MYLRVCALVCGQILIAYRMLLVCCVKSDASLCVCVCCAGAGLLLQSEGARLSDEERAGSFGNDQTEPALDGEEPVYAPKMALIQSLHPVSAPRSRSRGVSSRQQQCLHYCRTVSL